MGRGSSVAGTEEETSSRSTTFSDFGIMGIVYHRFRFLRDLRCGRPMTRPPSSDKIAIASARECVGSSHISKAGAIGDSRIAAGWRPTYRDSHGLVSFTPLRSKSLTLRVAIAAPVEKA